MKFNKTKNDTSSCSCRNDIFVREHDSKGLLVPLGRIFRVLVIGICLENVTSLDESSIGTPPIRFVSTTAKEYRLSLLRTESPSSNSDMTSPTSHPATIPITVSPQTDVPPTTPSFSPIVLPPAQSVVPDVTAAPTKTPVTFSPTTGRLPTPLAPSVSPHPPATMIPSSKAPMISNTPTRANRTTVSPTTASPVQQSPVTLAPVIEPTTEPPTTDSPTATPPHHHSKKHHHSGSWLVQVIGKTIAWLIITALGVLGIAFVMNNRYRIYYLCRYAYYRFRTLPCTRRIVSTVVRHLPPFMGGGGDGAVLDDPTLDTNLNAIIFEEENNMSEGLLMRESIQ